AASNSCSRAKLMNAAYGLARSISPSSDFLRLTTSTEGGQRQFVGPVVLAGFLPLLRGLVVLPPQPRDLFVNLPARFDLPERLRPAVILPVPNVPVGKPLRRVGAQLLVHVRPALDADLVVEQQPRQSPLVLRLVRVPAVAEQVPR